MSILSGVLQGGIGGFLKGGLGGVLGGALGGAVSGGNGGPNIAKSLSKQVGCTIAQTDANQARALLKRGVDPCTGQNTRLDTSFDTGVQNRTVLFDQPGAGGAMPIPVFNAPTVTGPGGKQMATRTGGSALEFTATGLVRSVIVNGRRISRKNAAAFIRKAGMEVGARGLGLSLEQAAMVVIQQSTRPRRRRGISGAQITQAKRVITTINSMAKQLKCGTTRRAPARKPSCR